MKLGVRVLPRVNQNPPGNVNFRVSVYCYTRYNDGPNEQKTTKEKVFPRKNSRIPPRVIRSPPLKCVLAFDCSPKTV